MMFVLHVIEEVCRLQSHTIIYGFYFPYIYGLLLSFLYTSLTHWQESYIRKNIPFWEPRKIFCYTKKDFYPYKGQYWPSTGNGLEKVLLDCIYFFSSIWSFIFLRKHKQLFPIGLNCVLSNFLLLMYSNIK